MKNAQQQAVDRCMMTHCIALSKESGKAGEYPYAAVVCRDGAIVAESINRVAHDGDVTRHAEVVAISLAQKTLRSVSLDDCEMYVNSEPRSRRLPLARFRSRHTSYVSLAPPEQTPNFTIEDGNLFF